MCAASSGLPAGLLAVCGGADAVGLAEEDEEAGGGVSDAAVPTEAPVNEGEAVKRERPSRRWPVGAQPRGEVGPRLRGAEKGQG
eukprot:COSAG05_NODE_333_length_11249_cov_629.633094_2_plen_84_part_00